MCAESSSSEGRILLPPPSRRYSAISVMVLTLDAASRPSSCSTATKSSRSSSKTSLAVAMVSVLKVLRFYSIRCEKRDLPEVRSICAVIRELKFEAEILGPQHRDNRLQLVAVLA